MFKKLAVGCLLLILLVVGVGIYLVSTLPTEISESSSRTIAASAEQIHPLVEDFRRWPEWSAWHAEDPTITSTYSGSETGEGAIVNWVGAMGPGGMTATASDPSKGFWYDLTLGEAGTIMTGKGVVTYSTVPDGTLVTFEMRADLDNLVSRVIAGFGMPEKIKESFETNLTNIAGLVEEQ